MGFQSIITFLDYKFMVLNFFYYCLTFLTLNFEQKINSANNVFQNITQNISKQLYIIQYYSDQVKMANITRSVIKIIINF